MKGKLSLLIAAAAVSASFAVPVQAADYEKLVAEVKSRIDIPAEYTKFEFLGENKPGEKKEYSFEWSDPSDEKSDSIFIVCAEDGRIMQYYSHVSADRYDYLKADTEKSAEAAEKFIIRTNPQLEGKIRLEPNKGYMYGPLTLSVYAVCDGVEYYRPVGNVDITSGGIITRMDMNAPSFEDISGSAEDYLSEDEAYKLYMERIGCETVYMTYSDKDDKIKSFPVYRNRAGKAIDAVTGEVMEYNSDDITFFAGGAGAETAADKAENRGLSEQEINEIAKINSFISSDEAVAAANKRLGISFVPEYISLGGRGTAYSYHMSNKNMSVSVNASNGDLLLVSIYKGGNTKLPAVFDKYDISDKEQAAELIKLLAPKDGVKYTDNHQYVLEDDYEEASFEYRVNNIPVNEVTARINKSEDSVFFHMQCLDNYEKCVYAYPQTFKAPEEIFKTGFVKLRLVKTDDGLKPAYITDDYTVSAVTGDPVNYKGETVGNDDVYTYSDIEGHWIEETAKKLAVGSIGFGGGVLKPDAAVTRAEAEEMLNQLYYSDKDAADKDEILTRRAAAVLIADRLGLSKLAAADVFARPYDDTTSDFGAIAILKGLGVISATSGDFRPDAPLTRAELLQIVFNLMISEE